MLQVLGGPVCVYFNLPNVFPISVLRHQVPEVLAKVEQCRNYC